MACFHDNLEGGLIRSQAWFGHKCTQPGIQLLPPISVRPPGQEFNWRPTGFLLDSQWFFICKECEFAGILSDQFKLWIW